MRAALLARLLGLLLAFGLTATTPAAAYPGEWPATNERASQIRDAALSFWQTRWAGPLPCDDGAAVMATYAGDLTDSDGGALGRGMPCRIWLLDRFVRETPGPGPALYPTFRFYAALNECTVWVHELGHAFGLGHSATGVMSIIDDPYHIAPPPVECVHVARALDPRPVRATKARRARR